MARLGGYFAVKEEYDDFEDLPSASLSQTFFAVQHRPGKQGEVQVKKEPYTTPVMKRSAGFWASLGPSPSSLFEDCGDEESTPIGPFHAFLDPPNGSRKRLCKPVDKSVENAGTEENDGYKRDGCFHTMSFETSNTPRARMASIGNTSLSSFFEWSEGLRHGLQGDVRNVQNSESMFSTSDHHDISVGGIFEDEFAAFRKPTQSSTTTQPCISAALSALRSAASKGQILHVEKIPARPAAYSSQDFNLHKKLTKALQARC